MSSSQDPDLVKVTEVFLIPNSFLVAALGTADTNPHRFAVSMISLVISVLWWVCSREAQLERLRADPDAATGGQSRRIRIMSWLPVFFVGCWAASVVMHLWLWNTPLGH